MDRYTGVDFHLSLASSACKLLGLRQEIDMDHYTGVDLDLSWMPLPCYCQEGNVCVYRIGLRSLL
jgi:hypothetical protein